MEYIRKRDGRLMVFSQEKITKAIYKALKATNVKQAKSIASKLSDEVVLRMNNESLSLPTVELVQDLVEEVLIENGYIRVAKAYILYRAERTRLREMNTRLLETFEKISYHNRDHIKEGNANVNGDGPMSSIFYYGTEVAKDFNEMFVLKPEISKAHQKGDFFIHHLDFFTQTTSSCQIHLESLLKDGFSTGLGILREPKNITAYAILCCISLQSNQNDQDGCQAIADFDDTMAKGVKCSYVKYFYHHLKEAIALMYPTLDYEYICMVVKNFVGDELSLDANEALDYAIVSVLNDHGIVDDDGKRMVRFCHRQAYEQTNEETYQAMEGLIHNLNTIYSRAGAKVPSSTINYGLNTTSEGRMVISNLLKVSLEGIGNGQSASFPKQIFRLKKGVNLNPEDINYDLYQFSLKVAQIRQMPYYAFVREQEDLAYFENGIRVYDNVYDPTHVTSYSRGVLCSTTLNLVRLAFRAKNNLSWFFEELERQLECVASSLMDRLNVMSQAKAYYFPFLMGQGVFLDSEKLQPDDCIGDVLKQGTLSIGYIGLLECVEVLSGHKDIELAYQIVEWMRKYVDQLCQRHQLTFTLMATNNQKIADVLCKKDARAFKHHYKTYHLGFDLALSDEEQLKYDGKFHQLSNGGHLTLFKINDLATMDMYVQKSEELNLGLIGFLHGDSV